ncbi:MAG TPA: DUF1003 domain-containing protein [Candidatus Limnocylindrales bacterium]|nr:DUF1003 domain-containing protein [Candidatus Limnocylindrales bacterium]
MARAPYHHPVNRALIDEAPEGARIADLVTGFMGSWRFIIVQTVIVVIWLLSNIYLLSKPFDPYPFILLNLAFSTQAAYAAPLILLAGNRAAAHDRATLEHAADQADLEEKQNERLISAGQLSLKHLTEVAERILAIEETLHAQDNQLLRMEKAILAFEVDRSVHQAAGKARAARVAGAPAAKPAKA